MKKFYITILQKTSQKTTFINGMLPGSMLGPSLFCESFCVVSKSTSDSSELESSSDEEKIALNRSRGGLLLTGGAIICVEDICVPP